MAKRKHLNLYTPTGNGAKGEYNYTGDYYVPVLHGRNLRRLKIGLLFQCLIQFTLLFFIGSSDPYGLRTLYVMPFFLFLFFFMGRASLAAFGFFAWEERMTQSQYEGSWMRFRHSQMGIAITCGLLALSDIVMVLLGSPISKESALLVLSLPVIAISTLCFFVIKNVSCSKASVSLTPE